MYSLYNSHQQGLSVFQKKNDFPLRLKGGKSLCLYTVNLVSNLRTTSFPISNEAVAAGDGALHT